MPQPPTAVVLLSGGLDSATALAVARRDGHRAFALTFRYGQRHEQEIERASTIARTHEVERHLVVDLDSRIFAGSALTDATFAVPKDRSREALSAGVPSTYVPARNTVFLAHALAWAEVLTAEAIYIGVNALDYSGYPDCRPDYVEAFQRLTDLATKSAVEDRRRISIRAPLLHLTKAQIIRLGLDLCMDYGLTSSCYDPTPSGLACGRCDACQIRLNGFRECGVPDPIAYVATTT